VKAAVLVFFASYSDDFEENERDENDLRDEAFGCGVRVRGIAGGRVQLRPEAYEREAGEGAERLSGRT
jgi:hypothetical protein